jgi:hypothetical protein
VIPAVHNRGNDVGRLLRYLFGPGRNKEHVDPRLVAAWAGSGNLAALQPPLGPDGKHDVRRLTNLLEQPVRAARRAPPKVVWHCSVRNHPDDRILSDQQWGHIAAEIMAKVGLAPHGDRNAVRWVAVRHDDYGIHLVATLVRQDGRTAWAWNDYNLAQAACRDLEVRYNLQRVGPTDRTGRRRPKAPELNKTTRKNYPEVPRDRLRREVRAAAAAASDETDFFDRLRAAGLLVKARESSIHPGEITGYAVGLPGHRNAGGETVWYGGGKLAPDLTLPKLRHRWLTDASGTTAPEAKSATGKLPGLTERAETFRRAAQAARNAAEDLKHLTATGQHGAATALAQAAADMLTAAARSAEGRRGGPITDAAEAFDRAARLPNGEPPPRYRKADGLRAMARLIAVVGRLTGDHDTAAALFLIYHMAALAEHLADLREVQQRLHQVRDARHAAQRLRILTATGPAGGPAPRPRFTPAGGPAASPTTPNHVSGR